MRVKIKVHETREVEARFDKTKKRLEIVRGGKLLAAFDDEIVDSGALVGHLDEGQVVLPLHDDRFPGIKDRLAKAGVVELTDRTWATWGGDRYVAARVLI